MLNVATDRRVFEHLFVGASREIPNRTELLSGTMFTFCILCRNEIVEIIYE